MSFKRYRKIEWRYEGDCIITVNRKLKDGGYPVVRLSSDGWPQIKIARLILFKRYGMQPPSVYSRHTCDNKACINPDHIIPGSHLDNMRDMYERGGSIKSEDVFTAKLSPRDVLLILSSNDDSASLALKFGVQRQSINRVKRGATWRRVYEQFNEQHSRVKSCNPLS